MHAERHILEVCQFEIHAVFTSTILPGRTHAYTGLQIRRWETDPGLQGLSPDGEFADPATGGGGDASATRWCL